MLEKPVKHPAAHADCYRLFPCPFEERFVISENEYGIVCFLVKANSCGVEF